MKAIKREEEKVCNCYNEDFINKDFRTIDCMFKFFLFSFFFSILTCLALAYKFMYPALYRNKMLQYIKITSARYRIQVETYCVCINIYAMYTIFVESSMV